MKVQHSALDAYSRASTFQAKNAQGAKRADQADGDANAKAANGSGDAANVSISAEARALAEGTATPASTEPVDTQKVAALKAQIAAGTFKVDAKTVASRMLDRSG